MENRGFRPTIQRHPDRLPQPAELDDVGTPIWDTSKIDEPKVPDSGDKEIDDDANEEDDDSDEGEPDYDKDIKPYHRVPVQQDHHPEPPPHPEDIPFDEDADRRWRDQHRNPDDPLVFHEEFGTLMRINKIESYTIGASKVSA